MVAYWDIPVFAEYNDVRANRVDTRKVDHGANIVKTLKMSCPWTKNREKKGEEKMLKYRSLYTGNLYNSSRDIG